MPNRAVLELKRVALQPKSDGRATSSSYYIQLHREKPHSIVWLVNWVLPSSIDRDQLDGNVHTNDHGVLGTTRDAGGIITGRNEGKYDPKTIDKKCAHGEGYDFLRLVLF